MVLSEDRTKILVENLRNNDSSAFSELYIAHFPRVYKFCYRFLKSKELAQECTQLAFIKIWENRGQLNIELNFKSYLFTISKNAVLKTIERAAREKVLKQNVLVEYQSNSDVESDKALEALANKAFEQLPPQRQVVFKLCKIEGRSYEEAAVMLGISHGTVRDHIFKASKSIRKYLSHHGMILVLFATSLALAIK